MENITANVQSLTGNLALDTIVSGLITLVVCYIAIRIVKALVAKALGKATKLELPVKNLINKAVTFVLWAVAIIIVAGACGINSASLVALLSVVGLALSMSVQGLLGNFFSGILLLINKPFKEGDFVEAGDKVGVIKSIGFFNTTINTLDNVSMVVPNGDLTGATVKNYSREPLRRVDMTFCTSYDVSTEDAKKAILDAIAKDERILADPAPFVRLGAYKGSVCSNIMYDEGRAHKIYAGADALLVPSQFEPCGLTQLIAMHYGTVPIVRETGGLKDTVEPYNQFTNYGNGFTFDRYDAGLLLDAINRAKTLYFTNRWCWDEMVQRDMDKDVSWENSAKRYRQLYVELTQ